MPYTISSSGSYYLTKPFVVPSGNAIVIVSDDVTLDLNGFFISSVENPAANSNAIIIGSARSNITIMNGTIFSSVVYFNGSYGGTGFGNGIAFGGSQPVNVRVRGVTVSGVLTQGIYLGFGGTTVESCTVNTVGAHGIWASSVSNSTATNTGDSAIYATTAINCIGVANANHGVDANSAQNCYGTAVATGHGIFTNTASNCYGSAANGDGVNTFTALGCQGTYQRLRN